MSDVIQPQAEAGGQAGAQAARPPATPDGAPLRKRGALDILRALRQRKVAVMLGLGFGSGLPFMLTAATLGFWLREEGLDLTTIGYLSWVGLAYSLKFLWAPLVDAVDAPVLGRLLGRRRGWMALSQMVVAAGLAGMAAIGPTGHLLAFTLLALVVAFGSATQDIVVDAFRIEAASNDDELGLLASTAALGYRAAILTADALILILAAAVGWSASYLGMAALMGVGLVATLFAAEPVRAEAAAKARHALAVGAGAAARLGGWARGGYEAVAGPFLAFLKTHGPRMALLMLAAISLYRLPDFIMGPMAGPLYIDLGLSKTFMGGVRATVGLWAGLLGIAAAGVSAVRLGFTPTLVIGAVLGPASNLAFTALAIIGRADPAAFTIAMAVDGFATGYAGTALVAYMSSLTSLGYTATQYALLSSFYALLGKVMKGFSGRITDALKAHFGQMEGYALFFAGTAAVGVPAVILCLLVAANVRRRRAAAPVSGDPVI